MNERRKLQRFSLNLPARIKIIGSEEREVLNLLTRNISSNGAYFRMREPIAKDIQIQASIIMKNDFLQKITGSQSIIKINGTVVRSDPNGIAVHFATKYQIVTLVKPRVADDRAYYSRSIRS